MKQFSLFGASLCVALIGCTPTTNTPALENSPGSKVSVESCRNTSLSFKTVTAANVRELINCLNGAGQALQAYKDFLDTADTNDLNLVFESLNKYLTWGSTRQIEFLDVIKAAKQKGILKEFLTNAQVLVESEFLLNVIKTIIPLIEKNSPQTPDADLNNLRLFLTELMQNKFDEKLLDTLSVFGQSHSKAMAYLMALPGTTGSLNSDQVTDQMSNMFLKMFDDQSFHELVVGLSKPDILKTFKNSTSVERSGFAEIFKYFSYTKSENNYEAFRKGQGLIDVVNKPMTCFQTNGTGGRTADSLLKYVVDSFQGKSKEQIDGFLLQTIPLLLATTTQVCKIPPGVASQYVAVTDLVQAGYGEQYAGFWTILLRNPQSALLVESLKSPYYVTSAPIIGELSRRAAINAFVDAAADDFTNYNAENLSQLFIKVTGPREKALINVLKKIFAADVSKRDQLKKVSVSLLATWADTRGGLGSAFKAASDVAQLTYTKPITSFFMDILSDEDYVNKLTPVLVRLSQNPHFVKALNLTGKLSGSGDLEKIIVFFVDLLRQGNPGLKNVEEVKTNETKSQKNIDPLQLVDNYLAPKDFQAINYDTCLNIKGDIFESSGQNFLLAMQCMNAAKTNPEIDQIAQYLKTKNLLPAVSKLSSKIVNTSPYMISILDQLEALLDKGQLTPLLKMYSFMGDPTLKLFDYIDPLTVAFASHPSADKLFTTFGWVLGTKEINQNLVGLVDITLKTPAAVYKADNNFRLKVADPVGVKKQIAEWYSDVSAVEQEKIYQTARENFETHNDDWKFVEGNYPRLSKDDFRNELLGLLNDFLRTTDLEEFIATFQSYAKDGSALDFVKYLSELQMVVLNYDENGNKKVHIQTGLDALENLVLIADFGYSYIDNIGTYFQLSIVDSTNFVATVDDQYRQVKLGHDVSSALLSKKRFRFKNMLSNYSVLQDLAKNGRMRVLQKIYQGLYRATPWRDQTNQDPNKNHMGLMNRFNRLGLFQNLSMAIQQTKLHGQTDNIVNAVVGLSLKVKPEDFPLIKKSFQIMTSQAARGQNAAFERALDLFWSLQNDPQNYEKFKSHLAHVVLAQDALLTHFSPIFKALPSLLLQPQSSIAAIESIFENLQKDDGILYKLSANALSLDSTSTKKLQTLLTDLMSRADTSDLLLMASDIYEKQPALFKNLQTQVAAYWNLPQMSSLNPQMALREALLTLNQEGSRGIWLGLQYLLSDPQTRKDLLELSLALGQGGQLKNLNSVLSRQVGSGELEQSLHFLFDHFKKSSLK